MFPFRDVPSKVPEKITSLGESSNTMLMLKVNLSALSCRRECLCAALARERAGKRAIGGHGDVGGRFFGAFGRGVSEFPFAGQVAFRRIFWLFGFVDRISAAIDEDEFDFCFFAEDVAVGDDAGWRFCRFRSSRGDRRRRRFLRKIKSARAARRPALRPASIDFFAAFRCLSVRRRRRNRTRTSRWL